MANYTVRVTFLDSELESGEELYVFPLVQNISIPKEAIKATVINGTRGNGCLVINGGKKSKEIIIKGKIWGEDYLDLITKINALKASVTNNIATVSLEHYDADASGGGAWIVDNAYTVKLIDEITFGESMLTDTIDYTVNLLVTSYT